MGRSLDQLYSSFEPCQPEPSTSSEVTPALILAAKQQGWAHALSAPLDESAVFEAFLPLENTTGSAESSEDGHTADDGARGLCPPETVEEEVEEPGLGPLSPSSGVFHQNTLSLPLELPRRIAGRLSRSSSSSGTGTATGESVRLLEADEISAILARGDATQDGRRFTRQSTFAAFLRQQPVEAA